MSSSDFFSLGSCCCILWKSFRRGRCVCTSSWAPWVTHGEDRVEQWRFYTCICGVTLTRSCATRPCHWVYRSGPHCRMRRACHGLEYIAGESTKSADNAAITRRKNQRSTCIVPCCTFRLLCQILLTTSDTERIQYSSNLVVSAPRFIVSFVHGYQTLLMGKIYCWCSLCTIYLAFSVLAKASEGDGNLCCLRDGGGGFIVFDGSTSVALSLILCTFLMFHLFNASWKVKLRILNPSVTQIRPCSHSDMDCSVRLGCNIPRGTKGYFPHWVDANSGVIVGPDTACMMCTGLLMSGVLFTKTYFTKMDPQSDLTAAISAEAESLYTSTKFTDLLCDGDRNVRDNCVTAFGWGVPLKVYQAVVILHMRCDSFENHLMRLVVV